MKHPPEAESEALWSRLQKQVVDPGNCTHCGACAGLSGGLLQMADGGSGPVPVLRRKPDADSAAGLKAALAVCPGRGVPYPELFDYLGRKSASPLLGPHVALYTGHATDERIRRRAASGGIISALLIYLLDTGAVDGALVLQQGREDPETASPFIATSVDEILQAAQSVYAVTPTLDMLPAIERFPGNLAVVGLPDQVAAIRMLQAGGHAAARKVRFVIGPYVGTNMYHGAIRSFLRANGVDDATRVSSVKWRAGEWPGYLQVTTADGRVFQAEKFYYNYLIPFYIARSCLLTPDFANEAADLSVGDAWSPALEAAGGGYSVVVARSTEANEALQAMRRAGKVHLEKLQLSDALAMHAHMIEFKKRGSAIRIGWASRGGNPAPDFGYRVNEIPLSRVAVEAVLFLLFTLGRLPISRWLAGVIPGRLMGAAFAALRRRWKAVSKPVKRKGLATLTFRSWPNPERWKEILEAFDSR